MKTKTEYKLIRASSASRLEQEVNYDIAKGWEVSGGVSSIVSGVQSNNFEYSQAMIKIKEIGNE